MDDPLNVADDIIRSVVSAADREQAIEEMFFALYTRLARTEFGLVGDWDAALAISTAHGCQPGQVVTAAAALGVSVGTVKSQTHKALRQLRDAHRCQQVTYGGSQLWLACGRGTTDFLRVNPAPGLGADDEPRHQD